MNYFQALKQKTSLPLCEHVVIVPLYRLNLLLLENRPVYLLVHFLLHFLLRIVLNLPHSQIPVVIRLLFNVVQIDLHLKLASLFDHLGLALVQLFWINFTLIIVMLNSVRPVVHLVLHLRVPLLDRLSRGLLSSNSKTSFVGSSCHPKNLRFFENVTLKTRRKRLIFIDSILSKS